MSERKLATLRVVSEIWPIPNADAIETALVDGWQVVVKKGEFKPGDLTVFFEIDSFLPVDDARYEFLAKNAIFYNGETGIRLRTVKLRGQISQGLALPVFAFDEVKGLSVGDDLTEALRVKLWERPQELSAGGSAGSFPHFLRKSDQERIQNLTRLIQDCQDDFFEVTEKLEGSSMTVYKRGEEVGVCSRNMRLVENVNNRFWATALKDNAIESLKSVDQNLALQGELIGPAIQGNIYKLNEYRFCVYNVWDIDNQVFMHPTKRTTFLRNLASQGYPLNQVPKLGIVKLSEIGDLGGLLAYADGYSAVNSKTRREGVVFKHMVDSSISFKVISNNYLLKEAA